MPSEVKVFRSDLPSQSDKAPSLFSSFAPYPDDSSGVSVASGFVDFATGRYSIVTAPGAGSPAAGEGIRLPADAADRQKTASAKSENAKSAGKTADMCPEDAGKPNLAAAFMPFGLDYKGGVSLATGWLGGTLGGAETDRGRPARRPRPSEGVLQRLALQGGPAMISPPPTIVPSSASAMASFTPFDGGAAYRGDHEHDARRYCW